MTFACFVVRNVLVKDLLRFHAAGDWSADELVVHRSTIPRPTTAEIELMIEAAWEGALARPGIKLFNGQMCRLESWREEGGKLHLTLGQTTYREFLGTNLAHPELAEAHSPAHLANPVGVSPALLTADNFLMMGRRNASVAYYPNRIHPFAGALDPEDADPFEAIRRELNEELGFNSADIAEMRCTGIAEDLSIRQPELIFYVRSTRTRAEIEAALDPTEHDTTWHLPATAECVNQLLADSLKTSAEPSPCPLPEYRERVLNGDFTPVAFASLILYAHMMWRHPLLTTGY